MCITNGWTWSMLSVEIKCHKSALIVLIGMSTNNKHHTKSFIDLSYIDTQKHVWSCIGLTDILQTLLANSESECLQPCWCILRDPAKFDHNAIHVLNIHSIFNQIPVFRIGILTIIHINLNNLVSRIGDFTVTRIFTTTACGLTTGED